MAAVGSRPAWSVFSPWLSVALLLPVIFLPEVVGDAISGLVVLGALAVAVRSLRRLGRGRSWRLLTAGGVAIGLGPALTEVHVATLGDHPLTIGDAFAFAGYGAFIAGIRRLAQVRTMAPDRQSALDAGLWCSWLAFGVSIAAGRAAVDGTTGWDTVAALSYVPFSLLLLFYLLRLVLGAGGRSMSFQLLVVATAFVGASELAFLRAAAGTDGASRVGVVLATIALVLFAWAIAHPTATELETPGEPKNASVGVMTALAVVATYLVVALLPVLIDLRPFEAALLVGLAILTSVRVMLLVVERDEWVRRETNARELASALVEGSTPEIIIDLGLAAAEETVEGKELTFVGLHFGDELEDALHERADPLGVEVNEIDGDVGRALESRETQRTEFAMEQTRSRYATRLVIPIDGGRAGHGVMLVETAPVLSPAEIGHLELLAANLGLALKTVTERANEELERSNRKFRALVQDSSDIVMLIDATSSEVSLVSPTVLRLLGYDEDSFLGRSPTENFHPDDADLTRQLLDAQRETEEPIDVRVLHDDGQLRWFAMTIRDMTHDDELRGFVVSLTDIHARKMAEVQVTSSESRFRSLIEQASDVFVLVADDLRFNFVSPNIERLLGYTAAELIGTHIGGVVTARGMEDLADLIAMDRADLDGRIVEVEVKNRQGELRWVEVTLSDGDVSEDEGLMVAVRDITARREMEESMREAALHDPLTGLFNRASLQHELHNRLQRMSGGERTGVIHLDVRDFKVVNESLGFAVGHELLVEIANRLRSALRADDTLARLTADSFAVLTTARADDEVTDLAARLQDVFDDPFHVGGRERKLGIALGLTSTRDRRGSAINLLEEAGLAVRRAKLETSGIFVFESWLRDMATERFEIESDLLPALAAGQFSVVYQPLLVLRDQRVRGVEALLRWQHPERGHISPGTFIPVAEQTGAIVELGRWVLEEACRQLVTWHETLPDGRGLGMSVNVSARQLEDPDEFDVLHQIIRDTGVDPNLLTLEVTESMDLDDIAGIRVRLDRFREIGVSIAVDDFGSGTAGLNHMRDVPFDILKVDKTYVDPLGKVDDAYSLLAGMVDLAHAMGAMVVAEGIETPQQAAELRRMHCDIGQGFFLGRPMDPARLEDWFARGREGEVASQIQQLRV